MGDYKHKCILTIAEYKSFSKAADALYVSQPYLSKLVQTIENELGVKLFNRKHSPLTVTAAGERYLEYIKTVIHVEQQMYTDINEISQLYQGEINFGVGLTYGSYVLPLLLQRFKEFYPHIRVNIEETSNKGLVEHVESGVLDLAILTSPDAPTTLNGILLKKDKLLLVLPPNFPIKNLTSSSTVIQRDSFKRLEDEQFIVLTEFQGIGMFERKIFKEFDMNPKILYEVKNVETAYRLVAAGFGVTIIPEICRKYNHFEIEPYYYEIGSPPLTRDVVMIYRKGWELSLAQRKLCEIAQLLV